MGATLSNGYETIETEYRLGFDSENESRNVVHAIIGGGIKVSLAPDMPRTGSLDLLFLTATDAENARKLLTAPAVWTLVDDLEAVTFAFVRLRSLRASQQENRNLWVLSVGFQEVTS